MFSGFELYSRWVPLICPDPRVNLANSFDDYCSSFGEKADFRYACFRVLICVVTFTINLSAP